MSFAHQEGDLGFVELRLALSGNAASVTDASTRKVALQRQSAETSQMGRKQVKRSFTLSQYSLKSVCPWLKGTVCTLCLRAVCAVCAVCTLFARCLHVLSALSALSACCLHVVCMLSACYLHLFELDKAGSIANCSTPIVTPIVNSDSDSDSVR